METDSSTLTTDMTAGRSNNNNHNHSTTEAKSDPCGDSTATTPEIVTVSYEDLITFDQKYNDVVTFFASSSLTPQEEQTSTTTIGKRSRNQNIIADDFLLSLMRRIGSDAFGPQGLGIVVVEHVPHFIEYRQALLPLAAQIPNIPNVEETCTDPESYYQVGWSHGKEILSDRTTGTRQPDIYKGSYYANPFTNDLLRTLEERDGDTISSSQETTTMSSLSRDEQPQQRQRRRHLNLYTKNKWPPAPYVPQLESAFSQMGQLLHSVGCIIAKVCDAYCRFIHNSMNDEEMDTFRIATTILKSKNANGRLLHYFPVVDPTSTTTPTGNTIQTPPPPTTWCSWHNDHGLLTGLVPGMYIDTRTGADVTNDIHAVYDKNDEIRSATNTSSSSSGGSCGGLYIQARNGQCVAVHIPIHCCAYQIGETAQIMSGGLLQATPHAVFPPNHQERIVDAQYISRESFALFLEPEFEDVLRMPSSSSSSSSSSIVDDGFGSNDTTSRLGLRPISDRYEIGQTFGDFHLATVSTNNATL